MSKVAECSKFQTGLEVCMSPAQFSGIMVMISYCYYVSRACFKTKEGEMLYLPGRQPLQTTRFVIEAKDAAAANITAVWWAPLLMMLSFFLGLYTTGCLPSGVRKHDQQSASSFQKGFICIRTGINMIKLNRYVTHKALLGTLLMHSKLQIDVPFYLKI